MSCSGTSYHDDFAASSECFPSSCVSEMREIPASELVVFMEVCIAPAAPPPLTLFQKLCAILLALLACRGDERALTPAHAPMSLLNTLKIQSTQESAIQRLLLLQILSRSARDVASLSENRREREQSCGPFLADTLIDNSTDPLTAMTAACISLRSGAHSEAEAFLVTRPTPEKLRMKVGARTAWDAGMTMWLLKQARVKANFGNEGLELV